jgi:hypothetical protein
MALNINIVTIPHSEQRYDTCGDWWWGPDATWEFRISKMSDWRYEMLVAIHELCECAMCCYMGISQIEVDEFDKAFEARRGEGDVSEPGDDSRAPYRVQHCIATGVERVIAALLGVSWSAYEDEINSLQWRLEPVPKEWGA